MIDIDIHIWPCMYRIIPVYKHPGDWMIGYRIDLSPSGTWLNLSNVLHTPGRLCICMHCAGIACSTFAGATEYLFRRHIYVVRWRRFSRSRISLRHRITSRRRFSKTLFPQPNFSPPPNYLAKTLFKDTFPAAEFLPATELPTEDAFRRHFSRSRISPRHRIAHRRRFSKTLFPQPNLRPPPNCPFRGEKE